MSEICQVRVLFGQDYVRSSSVRSELCQVRLLSAKVSVRTGFCQVRVLSGPGSADQGSVRSKLR